MCIAINVLETGVCNKYKECGSLMRKQRHMSMQKRAEQRNVPLNVTLSVLFFIVFEM